MAEATPMMRQYMSIKEKYSDCILFFRLGDFYEMFNEDAKIASKELDLMLTTRDLAKENPDERTPMCGVPYHSSEAYIARLIAKGYKVAICEQTEDPALAKGLVERDVIRIVTPGQVMESSMLDETRSNYICSICADPSGMALCFADISTGEICATRFERGEIHRAINELGRFSPAEAVISRSVGEIDEISRFLRDRLGCLTEVMDERFDYMQSAMRLCEQFDAPDMDALGLGDEPTAVRAVGGLLSYITETQKTNLSHINSLEFYTDGKYMELDVQTVRNLELTATMRTLEKKGSLLWALDRTKTSMGGRLMRSWLSRPLLNPAMIKRRQSAVNELFCDSIARSELIFTLREIGDIERIIGKIVFGSANCRDLNALAESCERLPELVKGLSDMKSSMLAELKSMDTLSDIRELVFGAITDDPPFSVREGGMIAKGYNEEVDYLRGLLENSTDALAAIESREKERTGKKLKVSYNKVFGYYIEIPRSMSDDVPDDYIRKQTLTNCERFITQELKELETALLTAKDKLAELEFRLFTEIREKIASDVLRVQATADAVAALDVLCSLAEVASKNDYCMPDIDLSGVIDIKDGRHPVVELTQTDALFVPNDLFLDGGDCRTAIITGPNMAGKSTYMRQTALIVLMAQIGSFVPARSARIGLVDRVFTRIGASDDLSAGKSTFMVEMTEVADILKSATPRSLILLDEIGRGTSTYDGMSIARAVLEHCTDRKRLGAKTMFATHYHELTAMEGLIDGVKNFSISAKKRGGELIFLRKIVPCAADDSYGIEVAALAGVPDNVVKRAKDILKSLEDGAGAPAPKTRSEDAPREQITMLDMRADEITERLRGIDINTVTPIEALNLLYELKKKADGEE
ncbi:MAG: DNA mismatch repair protein MutS [Oscillospiraceae bacterium]|nr:DNA mismatch repair protein MutS [Oscillospiraceae bacterium]